MPKPLIPADKHDLTYMVMSQASTAEGQVLRECNANAGIDDSSGNHKAQNRSQED